jgi:hypothetical protein
MSEEFFISRYCRLRESGTVVDHWMGWPSLTVGLLPRRALPISDKSPFSYREFLSDAVDYTVFELVA